MKQILIVFALMSSAVLYSVQIADVFSDGMVFQQGKNSRLWGRAAPAETITLTLGGVRASAKTDVQGRWLMNVSTPPAGGPYTLVVRGEQSEVRWTDVYVGDVWIAGGQSNMYFQMRNVKNASEVIASASNPLIRTLRIPLPNPLDKAGQPNISSWSAATGKTLEWMTAVGYFFARELQSSLGIPIGIVSCNRGSTSAETWVPADDLMKEPLLYQRVKSYHKQIAHYAEGDYEQKYTRFKEQQRVYNQQLKAGNKRAVRPSEPMGLYHPSWPSGMYEGMLQRIVPLSAKGVIWYQGEANSKRYEEYVPLMKCLIASWRRLFRMPEMPFYQVQLSNYSTPQPWPELRQAQYEVAQEVKNCGIVLSLNCGMRNDIHPIDKEPVGRRLAAVALAQTYGRDIPFRGPERRRCFVEKGKVVVEYKYADKGLFVKGGGDLLGFMLAGEDQIYYPVQAIVNNNNRVELISDKVVRPRYIRYGWASWTDANLMNGAGFPAVPFECKVK